LKIELYLALPAWSASNSWSREVPSVSAAA